jgi:recombination protein U
VIKIPKNLGKVFEDCIKASFPPTCWVYRLRDNAASFSGGENTRFTSSNICDYIAFDDITKTLYLLELKSTQGTSIPLSMIRDSQIKGLLEASKFSVIPGFFFNFRNAHNDTFFLDINTFDNMIHSLDKKSFNIKDLESYNAIRIDSHKKRTRYDYDINKFLREVNK